MTEQLTIWQTNKWPFNPLSLNIHMQIPQADLRTFF